MRFKTTAEDEERGQQWRVIKACCTDERLQQETLCHRQWTDECAQDKRINGLLVKALVKQISKLWVHTQSHVIIISDNLKKTLQHASNLTFDFEK